MIYGRHRLPTKDNTLKVPGGTIRVNGKINFSKNIQMLQAITSRTGSTRLDSCTYCGGVIIDFLQYL